MEPREPGSEPEKAPKLNGNDRDPMEAARKLRDEYSSMKSEFEAPGGPRERFNRHMGECYRQGFFYYQSLKDY